MRLTHSARHVFCALSLALTPTALTAQHPFAAAGATFDPRVPTARSVLGYEVGDRFTPHHVVTRYFERVAAASPPFSMRRVNSSPP